MTIGDEGVIEVSEDDEGSILIYQEKLIEREKISVDDESDSVHIVDTSQKH